MKLPAGRHLPNCPYSPFPYYLVGDEIFPYKSWLMKPFPGKLIEERSVYNYRHSRLRCVIENSFDILGAWWRIFSKPIKANAKNVENYVWAAICVHNYLRLTENATYAPAGFFDSADNLGFQEKKTIRGSPQSKLSNDMKNGLKDYVNSESGTVEWHLKYVRSTGNSE